MKNKKQEIYKNFKIINFGDNYIIVDYKGLTQRETQTKEQAKNFIDYIIQEQEQKQKVFESLKELNNTTKKAQDMIEKWNNATKKFLCDCYTTQSQEKQIAFNNCFDIYNKLNGKCFFIPTYNQWQFTFAFKFVFGGNVYLCYITKSQNYKIKID